LAEVPLFGGFLRASRTLKTDQIKQRDALLRPKATRLEPALSSEYSLTHDLPSHGGTYRQSAAERRHDLQPPMFLRPGRTGFGWPPEVPRRIPFVPVPAWWSYPPIHCSRARNWCPMSVALEQRLSGYGISRIDMTLHGGTRRPRKSAAALGPRPPCGVA
jgi:hypothetical protein